MIDYQINQLKQISLIILFPKISKGKLLTFINEINYIQVS